MWCSLGKLNNNDLGLISGEKREGDLSSNSLPMKPHVFTLNAA